MLKKKALLFISAVTLSLVGFTATASAHVSVKPAESAAGSWETYTMKAFIVYVSQEPAADSAGLTETWALAVAVKPTSDRVTADMNNKAFFFNMRYTP